MLPVTGPKSGIGFPLLWFPWQPFENSLYPRKMNILHYLRKIVMHSQDFIVNISRTDGIFQNDMVTLTLSYVGQGQGQIHRNLFFRRMT